MYAAELSRSWLFGELICMKKRHINTANVITTLRIVGTPVLLFLRPLTVEFIIAYSLTGVTDVLDGLVARMTHTVSELGARLDSVADLVFYTVMLVKIFPELWAALPMGVWVLVGAVLIVRGCAYAVAAVKYRCFASQHTYLNKLTGAAVFLAPYVLAFAPHCIVGYCWGVAAVAMLASLEELVIHLVSREYDAKVKTIFMRRR